MYYIGLDIHKKTISYCAKDAIGKIVAEGSIPSTRAALDAWRLTLPQPWTAAMEATMFTGWIYDYLRPHAAAVKVAHPMMLRAITAAKKKNDEVDARKIADALRCDLLPECYMAPTELRDRRRVLRYRTLLVRQGVQMKNRISGMLMETGVSYNKKKLHQKRYFAELLQSSEEIPESIKPLMKIGRETVDHVNKTERALLRALESDPALAARVQRLATIPCIGLVTALTWVLEVGEVQRFKSLGHAVSYCGLCSAQASSAGVAKRAPISKQRNEHLQAVLVEAAKLSQWFNADLTRLHENALKKGNRNRATLAVARKLVAYLLAVDRRDTPFQESRDLAEIEAA